MKRRHVCAAMALSSQLVVLAATASADTTDISITNDQAKLAATVLNLQGCTLTLTAGGTQITFTPSAQASQLLFHDPNPANHTFSFGIDPIPLGGGKVGTLTLETLSATNFGLAIGADGLEFTATLSATANVHPSAAIDIASGYYLPGGFDISINSATIFANATLQAAGTGGGISFAGPRVNAPFTVSNCTGVVDNPLTAPFLPPVLPCDGIMTKIINGQGGVSGPLSSGLGSALVKNWPTVVVGIEGGLTAWANMVPTQSGVPAPNGHPWGVVQGTVFTEDPCRVGGAGQACIAAQFARKATAPPTCKITPDSCDFRATLTCTGVDTDLGDKLRVYGMAQGTNTWTLLATQAANAGGGVTVQVTAHTPTGGANETEKFSVWNYDPQNQNNSAWDSEAQVQTATLNGAFCTAPLCTTPMVCKLPNGTSFMPSVTDFGKCALLKGTMQKGATTCTPGS